jgi:hypothetical protein
VNFNVYLDEPTVERLNRLARTRKTTRNALIREAVGRLLERDDAAGWPALVTQFEGVPDTPPFESFRRTLRAPRKNPLR